MLKQARRPRQPKLRRTDPTGALEAARSLAKGSNQHFGGRTCVECGYPERTRVKKNPVYAFENCPHAELDRRGSARGKVAIYCKQCCNHLQIRDRDENYKGKEMTSASGTLQQKPETTAEEEFTMEELRTCVRMFSMKMEDHAQSKATVTSTQTKTGLDEATKLTKARGDTTSSAVRQPTAYMMTFEPNTVEAPVVATFEEVDIYADDGIWICLDEGCNSNCHGVEWAQKCRGAA